MGETVCPGSLSAPDEPQGCSVGMDAGGGQAQLHTGWQSPMTALFIPGCGIHREGEPIVQRWCFPASHVLQKMATVLLQEGLLLGGLMPVKPLDL